MNRIYKVSIGLIIIAIIFFGVSVLITYKKINPFMNNLFEKSELLENDQELTDSVIKVIRLENKEVEILSFKDKMQLMFVSSKGSKSLFNGKKQKTEISKSYVIVVDTVSPPNQLKTNYFFINKDSLPFKHKELVFPYTIIIENNQIISSFVGY